MAAAIEVISPVDGSLYVRRDYATSAEIDRVLRDAVVAQRQWRQATLSERAALCSAMVDHFAAQADCHAEELAWQMGRPVRYGQGEVNGFIERARHMIAIAEDALSDVAVGADDQALRYIKRVPLGVVFTIAPWNYPYLTAVNSIVPAIMAGNAVVIKHAAQTPLCAERICEAFTASGADNGLVQCLHLTHQQTAAVIGTPGIAHVAFTGSVPGGEAIERAAAGRFIGVGLELGGKDPAYVRADAPFDHTVENLVDGAFFNSGQSCCGIERIYVHADIHDAFVDAFVDQVRGYRLGNPLDAETTLGPVVRASAAEFVRGQIAEAGTQGARALIRSKDFPEQDAKSAYLAPQVLVGVDHSMRVMTEESFGPVVGIMAVDSDTEAVELMNDSPFGLTASVWTADRAAAQRIGDAVETGTLFMNRCDYLDPALAWTGVKNSGRGCTLSKVGYDALTRPKSYNLRMV